jgi:threonine dehydrogenase-like Zn-dependent dehydrogenase
MHPSARPGTVLGHEAVGVVEEVGREVRNFRPGDRVVIASTIACGACSYCRAGYTAQCDRANPMGSQSGTCFFGGAPENGGIDGLQAERARIAYASLGMVKLPDNVLDEQAIFLSDIFPTAWFGAELAEIKPGDTVAIYGCGPVGQLAIAAAKMLGAGRVFAIDSVQSRLDAARAQGAEVIDFEDEDPIEVLHDLAGGIGVDRCVDALGVDANHPSQGPAAQREKELMKEFADEVRIIAPHTVKTGDAWLHGNAPSQVLQWAVASLAKAGTLSMIGVYPASAKVFPSGDAMNKNLTVKMGNCNHRKYIPHLLELIRTGAVDPTRLLSHVEPLTGVIDAYRAFDQRWPGWMKVELSPAGVHEEPARVREGAQELHEHGAHAQRRDDLALVEERVHDVAILLREHVRLAIQEHGVATNEAAAREREAQRPLR